MDTKPRGLYPQKSHTHEKRQTKALPELSGPRRPVDMTLGSSSTRTQLGFSFCQKALSEPAGEM